MSPEAFAGIKSDAISKGVLAYNGMAGDEGMFLFWKTSLFSRCFNWKR